MRRLRVAFVGILLVGLAACGTGQAAVDQRANSQKRFIAGDGTVSLYDIGKRTAAPKIQGKLLDKKGFSLSQVAGKVVVINFWAQWCSPCRVEADDLVEVYEATRASGVEFLGVNIQDTRDKARAFERAFKVSYPSLFDPAGRIALGFRDTPPSSTPATIILDRDHRVAAVFRKAILVEDLQPVVERIAAE